MRHARNVLTALVASLCPVGSAGADQDTRTGSPEKLGPVHFNTSCSPEAQKQ